MEKTLRKFSSHEQARAETYRYWHGRSDAEVFDAIAEMSEQMWSSWYKTHGMTPNVETPKWRVEIEAEAVIP